LPPASIMPATKPAGREEHSGRKRETGTLRFGHFCATGVGDPVLSGVNLLDKVTLDELRERPRDVLPREIEVQRDDRRRLDCEDLGVREGFEDAILALRHPLGSVPQGHNYATVLARALSNVAWSSLGVTLCYAFVTRYKQLASRHGCNDRPGASGEGLRAGAADPIPGGRTTTTMMSDNADGLSSRPSTDALATIARADRAYHDPAQFHLHEFGGGGA